MKAQKGSRDIAPLVLNFGFIWVWVDNATPLPLCPQEITPLSIVERLCGLQDRSGWYGEEKISSPYQNLNPGPSSL
jgi:hypothetical protein